MKNILKRIILIILIFNLITTIGLTDSIQVTAASGHIEGYGVLEDKFYSEVEYTSLKKGDTIKVKIYLNNISANVVDWYMDYDTRIFEKLDEDDCVLTGLFSVGISVDDTGCFLNFVSSKIHDITSPTLVATISLTLKQDISSTLIYVWKKETASPWYTDIACYHHLISSGAAISPGVNPDATSSTHLYTDYTHTSPVTDAIITNYVNGTTVTQNGIKKNYKSTILYTDILASYKYTTNAKGALVASTGKVIVGVTGSTTKPTLIKGKIVDKEAADIAKASIKNGRITVTAGSRSGKAYLWVIDTGDAGVSAYCPIAIKTAPTALNTYAISTDSPEFSYGKTKKYTSDKINVSESTKIYLYPTCNLNKVATEVEDATYSASVESKAQDYFTVTKDSSNPYCFIVTAKALQDGKSVSGKITIICDQNGKKAIFTATACNAVTDININNLTNLTSGQDNFNLKIGVSKTAKITGTMQIAPICVSASDRTTDTLKVYSMGTEAGFDADKMAAGTVKITKAASAKQKKVSISIGKDKKTLTVTSAKGATAGVTSYFLLVYNTTNSNGKGGYKVISVTTE